MAITAGEYEKRLDHFIRMTEQDKQFGFGIEEYYDVLSHYKEFNNPGAVHVFTVPVYKPFIPRDPDADDTEHDWLAGEIFSHYHDWKIEFCTEEILDYLSGEIPRQFAVNRIIAMKPTA